MYDKSIFIFRRDFRLYDNNGLNKALQESKEVIPCFIFTPEQIKNNDYKSDNAVQFMMESLTDLNNQLKKYKTKLYKFFDKPHEAVKKIIKELDIDCVYVNEDYSPYSIKRDKKIKKICDKNNVEFISVHDCLLNKVGTITTDGDVYQKFTPFYKRALEFKVDKPSKIKNYKNFCSNRVKIKNIYDGDLKEHYKINKNIWQNGGRNNALKILKNIKIHKNYNKDRNILTKETTNLSGYIKFGCLSIREVYYTFKDKLGNKNDLIKQLYWRDFYHNILWAYPRVIGGALKVKYNKIKWSYDKTVFKKWCEGKTGFPIVDACMRSMNKTGYMHNRGRLIVSNFLIKILMIDWQWGEKYFSQKLIDIDIANNNGNWQWGASTGADSQPYFRIMNPWSQSAKFDKNCEYIKKWIPELKNVESKHLHKWDEHYKDYNVKYPEPIVDYSKNRKKAIKMYKQIFK